MIAGFEISHLLIAGATILLIGMVIGEVRARRRKHRFKLSSKPAARHRGKDSARAVDFAPKPASKSAGEPIPEPDDQFATSSRPARMGTALFLLFWLFAWTGGIAFAALEFVRIISNPGEGELFAAVFLGFWLTVAIAAWLFVVRMIVKLLRG